MFNGSSSDLLQWYSKAHSVLRLNERLFLKFTLTSGLRKGEVINSFNLIIDLARQSSLPTYFSEELSALEHFRFREIFSVNDSSKTEMLFGRFP